MRLGNLPAGAIFSPDMLQTVDFTPTIDFAQSLDEIAPGIVDMTTQQAQASGENWIDSLARLLTAVVVTEQQRDLLRVQVERARAGQPPLNVSQYAGGAQIGLSSDTKWFAGLALAGVVAAFLLPQLLGRRR